MHPPSVLVTRHAVKLRGAFCVFAPVSSVAGGGGQASAAARRVRKSTVYAHSFTLLLQTKAAELLQVVIDHGIAASVVL